jgi:hypothetical protein
MHRYAMASGLRQTAACVVNILVYETFRTRGRLVSTARADWVSHGFLAVNESVHRTASQPRTSNPLKRTELPQIRKPLAGMIAEKVIFTAEEHLKTQRQIERRAHDLWCAGGCRDGTALGDWIQAEREVLGQFIWSYARGHALRRSSRSGASICVSRRKSEAGVLKGRRTITKRDLQSASALK